MLSRNRKIYKKIFEKPPTKKRKTKIKEEEVQVSILPKTSANSCTIKFGEEEKPIFASQGLCYGLDQDILPFQYSKRKVEDLAVISREEGFDPDSTALVEANDCLSSNSIFFDEEVPTIKSENDDFSIPENFDLEFGQEDSGECGMVASEPAMQVLAIWDDEQRVRVFLLQTDEIGDGESSEFRGQTRVLSLSELQVYEDVHVPERELKMETLSQSEIANSWIDDKVVTRVKQEVVEDVKIDPIPLDFSMLTEVKPKLEYDVEMDKRFTELLEELGLESIDDLELDATDIKTNPEDDFDFGMGDHFWEHLELLKKDIERSKLIRMLESLGG